MKLLADIGVEIDPATGGPIVNDLLETTVPGIFVAGNSLLINDLVDYVAEQGELAAYGAKLFIENSGIPSKKWVKLEKGNNIRLAVPHYLSGERLARIRKPIENVVLNFPEIDKKIRLPVVRPAEMLRIRLRKEEIAKAEDKITMEVVQ